MAKFLLVWELGGSFGHLSTLRTLAGLLVERGHRVALALSDRTHAAELFPNLTCLSTPPRSAAGPGRVAEPSTSADVLANSGWTDAGELAARVEAWRSLFVAEPANVVVCNYAPTAFLALQNYPARAALFGTGFYIPPDVTPLPDLCPWRNNYPDRLLATEQRVLRTLNKQLSAQRAPRVVRVARLFTRADASLFTTVPEMDHYPGRKEGKYIGPWGELPGTVPDWPSGEGPRVFAYLKPMEPLPYLLHRLRRHGSPTLVFAPRAAKAAKAHECDSLRVADQPLDIGRVAEECDFAILNAGHNATLQLLLAGKPVLALPLTGEQYLVAQNVVKLGAGVCVQPNQPREALTGLEQLRKDGRYTQAAQEFASKYANLDRKRQEIDVVQRLEALG